MIICFIKNPFIYFILIMGVSAIIIIDLLEEFFFNMATFSLCSISSWIDFPLLDHITIISRIDNS